MGKPAKPSTETTNTQPPAFVSAAQQSMLGGIQGTLNPYMMGDNFNKDQLRAYELTRQEAENPTQVAFTPMQGATIGNTAPMSPATMGYAGAMPAAAAMTTGLTANAYKRFMNPYEKDVIDTTLANSREELNRDLNTIRGRTAAGSAFGGSGARGALQEAQVTDDAGRRREAMVAQLRSQGFNQATASALANAQMVQQVNLANAAFEQQARQINTGNLQQAYAMNATNQQNANQVNHDADLQRALAQAGYQQQTNQFNAAGVNANALTNVGLQQQALQNLLGIGNQQYGYPLEAAKIMAAAIPKDYGSTSTTVKSAPQGPSMLQQLLGVGLSLGGAASTGGTSLLGGLGSLFGSKG
jgi:hypothetical protein